MITLVRWILMKQKEIKWKLFIWQFIDSTLKDIKNNPQVLEKKILPYIAEVIVASNHKDSDDNNGSTSAEHEGTQ